MISEFETRMANLLGTRLTGDFAGRVTVAPTSPVGPGPSVQVSVTEALPVDVDFRSVRREVLPDQTQFSRIVRLQCDVAIDVGPAVGQDRAQQLQGVDQILFLVDDGEFRDGTALVEPGDQGFRIDRLGVTAATAQQVRLQVTGIFWPPGTPGQDGPAIEQALIRNALLPIRLEPPISRITAGSEAVDLTLVVGTAGLDLSEGSVEPLPFGALAIAVLGQGGQPGAGELSGGVDGPDNRRLVDVIDGQAQVTYTPPPGQARDTIVVTSFTRDGGGNQRVGDDLARFDLRIES